MERACPRTTSVRRTTRPRAGASVALVAVSVLALAVAFGALLPGCGGQKDRFAGTWTLTGAYDASMVIARVAPSRAPRMVSSPASPSPAYSPVAGPYEWYVATFYLGREKPQSVLLLRRGDSLYAARTKREAKAGLFHTEMFRLDGGGLWGMSQPVLATNWNRRSTATKTPPW